MYKKGVIIAVLYVLSPLKKKKKKLIEKARFSGRKEELAEKGKVSRENKLY